jgi:death-on-curing protein
VTEWYYLTERDVMEVLAATDQDVQVRDFGLLSSAVARPRSSAFGEDAYPNPWVKAAALLHSLARDHAFVDGNKRAGWGAAWTFLEVDGIGRLADNFDVDAAEQLVLDVATGSMDELSRIAGRLYAFTEMLGGEGLTITAT